MASTSVGSWSWHELVDSRRVRAWSSEGQCCSAWARADREILEEGMLAEGRVIEAIELLSKVRDRHPLSTASWFDIPNRIGVLSAQLGED